MENENILDKVMTLNEACELYNVSPVTVRQACSGQHGNPPIFKPDECRKSGHGWIITKTAMERVYGNKKK